ncbi:hypothetical protein D3C87_1419990 [compost metagenome]
MHINRAQETNTINKRMKTFAKHNFLKKWNLSIVSCLLVGNSVYWIMMNISQIIYFVIIDWGFIIIKKNKQLLMKYVRFMTFDISFKFNKKELILIK